MLRLIFKHLLLIVAFCAFSPVLGSATHAQQRTKIPRIGILFVGGRDQPHLESFKQGLRERGYTEGKNIILEYRYADGDQSRLTELAAEFVREQVDVIVTTAGTSATAAESVTKTIPIVMTTGIPLEIGLAKSLARPGGNVTGLTVMLADLSGKRLEILKEALPKMTRVGVLWSPTGSDTGLQETEDAAKAFGLRLHSGQFNEANDLDRVFSEMHTAHAEGLIVLLSPLVTLQSKRIVSLARKYRLPGMYPTRQFAEEGGLTAYGPLIGDLYRRAATYVDKILKGAKPADLPVEQPMKFEFVVNLKAAKQIGLTIPPNVLARADWVIR